MAKVKGQFLGARALKDGTKTGMVVFPKETDRHALVDLEGSTYLTNDIINPDQDKMALLSDIRDKLERIDDYIDLQDAVRVEQIISNVKTIISNAMGTDYHLSPNEIDFILTNIPEKIEKAEGVTSILNAPEKGVQIEG